MSQTTLCMERWCGLGVPKTYHDLVNCSKEVGGDEGSNLNNL